MNKTSRRPQPQIWEAFNVAFKDKKKTEGRKWFTPLVYRDQDGSSHRIDTLIPKKKEGEKEECSLLWRTRTVGIRLRKNQKPIIDQWMRGYAIVFNSAVNLMTKNSSYKNVQNFQNELMNTTVGVDIPLDLKYQAVNEFLSQYNESKLVELMDTKCKYSGYFWVSNDKQVPGRYLSLYPEIFGESLKLKSHYNYPILHDYKIYKNEVGKYFVEFQFTIRQRQMKPNAVGRIVSIDPGLSTFATVYDPITCQVSQYGTKADCQYQSLKKSRKREKERFKRTIKAILNKISGVTLKRDTLLESCQCTTGVELEEKVRNGLCGRRKLRKYEFYTKIISMGHYRLKNKVEDLHKALANELVNNYEIIVVGDFHVNEHDNEEYENTMKKFWSHEKFVNLLQFKAREVLGCRVIIQDESWTSKTCGLCGTVKRDLGASKWFSCQNCHYETNRDVNGARNILQKYLGVFP